MSTSELRSLTIRAKLLRKIQTDPADLLRYAIAVARGTYYAAYYRLFRRNVRIRLPFLAFCKVSISGPGSVSIDRWCFTERNAFDDVSITTSTLKSTVRIGQRCKMGGLTIRCKDNIVIEDRAMFANALVQDTLFFSGASARFFPDGLAGAEAPMLRIGKGAWLSSQTMVLPGSAIGADSVLGLGSACYQAAVPQGHLALGNLVAGTVNIGRLDRYLRGA